MSETPETDAKVSGHIGFYSCATVPAELCRRLERERDEARQQYDDLATEHVLAVNKLAEERDAAQATLTDIHRWIERNHPDNFIDSMTFHQNLERVGDRWYDRLDLVERERDEAKKEIEGWRNKWECAVTMAARAENERYEARGQVEELTAVIKGLRVIMRQEAAQ